MDQSGIVTALKVVFRHPRAFGRILNRRNIKILVKALRTEPLHHILSNFKAVVDQTKSIMNRTAEIPGLRNSVDDSWIIKNTHILVRGWIITESDLNEVRLWLNDEESVLVNIGLERYDVATAFPDIKKAFKSGFYLNTTFNQRQISIDDKFSLEIFTAKDRYRLEVLMKEASDYGNFDLNEQYAIYQQQNKLTHEILERQVSQSARFKFAPKISIVTPVYNVDGKWLDKCIQSVLRQTYPNWELCLYDDASSKRETLRSLKEWSGKDQRIKIEYGQVNLHIARASNQAIGMASGDYLALLDNDDELTPDALFEVVSLLNKMPELDYIYSDEDKITTDGVIIDPHFKPGWAPETFESMMYTCHLSVFSKKIISEVGGFREGFEGSQDYDIVLRVTELTNKIFHIPKVLYHWRKIPGSAAASTDAKSYAYGAAARALAEHVLRQGETATIDAGKWIGSYRIRRTLQNPDISIIIPFRDELESTVTCIKSVLKSSYQNYELILLSNNSSPDNLEIINQKISGNKRIRILQKDGDFNFSAINNYGANLSNSEYLTFLNNDTDIITYDWLETLLEHASRRVVGAVGAKLFYPDRTVQHAGVVLGICGVGNHAFRNLHETQHGYFGYADVVRNCSAVTAACMMISREKFESVGGFDDVNLKISYNDVDLCLKLLEKGYRNIYTPFAEVIHHESKSRGSHYFNEERERQFNSELKYFEEKWSVYLNSGDPYYNPNLTRDREDFSLNLNLS